MENCWNVSKIGYIYQWNNDLSDECQSSLKFELENLYVEGKADKINTDYVIRHDIAASLSKTEREILRLPEIFPYMISIKHKGILTTQKFHYILSFFYGNGEPFVNPIIIGSYIKLSSEVDYMFNYYQFDIVNTVIYCNEKVKTLSRVEAMVFNFKNLAKIKQVAEKVDIKLNEYLKSKNVVVPDKLSIDIEQDPNGDYIIKPVLLEEKDNELVPLQSTESFQVAFSQQQNANSTYMGTDKKIYIMKPAVKEGLQEIKNKGKIRKEELERVKKQPKETFTSEAFEFNLGNYSDRVISIGEFVHKSLPYLKLTEGSWLPEEGTTFLHYKESKEQKELELPHMTQDNIMEIVEKIKIAQENNKDCIEYDGNRYPITDLLMRNAFETFTHFFKDNNTEDASESQTTKVDGSSTKAFRTLNIKDNIDELEYKSRNSIYKILTERMFEGLNPDIKLYEHQKKGVQWMFSCWKDGHHGVLLADDMGLGKTMQAYTFISGLKLSSPNQNIKSVLVVAPVSLLKNWETEFKKFIRSDLFVNIVKLYGGAINQYRQNNQISLETLANNQLVLTTYETLRDYQLSMGCVEWSVMVIDEAQKIKNPTTMVTTAVKAMKYDFGIALTGTPVENTWNDLWSIMDFVEPGKLGSLKVFHQKYQSKIKGIQKNKAALNELGERLQNELQPVFIRRLKKDILDDLPQKNIIKLEAAMPPVQQRAYETVIRNAKSVKGKIAKGQILKVIAQLRDISLCPYLGIYKDTALMNHNLDEIVYSSARLIKTFDILDEIKKKDEKVIIFVTSRKMQRVLKYMIEKKYQISVPPAINGEMQSERRQEVVSNFSNTEGFKVLLLSVESGGVGFNITAANNVIHLSRCWNPAKEDQATDRVYRIGQKKNVNVYLPIAYNSHFSKESSFDEKLDSLLEYKRNLSDSVLYPTGDNSDEGVAMLKSILEEETDLTLNEKNTNYGNLYWNIDDMMNVEGVVFEELIGNLFNSMPHYDAEVTPYSNDKGADIVVKCDDGKSGYLIQCKQTSTDKNMTQSGVVEVFGALSYYSQIYNRKFTGIVVTNARGFTDNAYELATANHVKLIAYKELDNLLKQYPVRKLLV